MFLTGWLRKAQQAMRRNLSSPKGPSKPTPVQLARVLVRDLESEQVTEAYRMAPGRRLTPSMESERLRAELNKYQANQLRGVSHLGAIQMLDLDRTPSIKFINRIEV